MNTSSNLQNKKLELIQWISTMDDNSIIEKIMELRKAETSNWWSSISEEERIGIELGIADADAGKLNDHSKARKLYEKLL